MHEDVKTMIRIAFTDTLANTSISREIRLVMLGYLSGLHDSRLITEEEFEKIAHDIMVYLGEA